LLNLSLWWSLGLQAVSLTVDPDMPRFAVTISNYRTPPMITGAPPFKIEKDFILLFDFSSPRPLHVWRSNRTADICFVRSNPPKHSVRRKSRLVSFRASGEMNILCQSSEDLIEDEDIILTSSVPSEFSKIYGATSVESALKSGVVPEKLISSLSALSLLEAPSHILPNPSDLCVPFLEKLLQNRLSIDQPPEKDEFEVPNWPRDQTTVPDLSSSSSKENTNNILASRNIEYTKAEQTALRDCVSHMLQSSVPTTPNEYYQLGSILAQSGVR